VYLLILTPAYNTLSWSPPLASHSSSSCSIYPGIAYYPLILVQFSPFRRGLLCKHYPAANDAACSLTFIVLHSIMTLWLLFHVENSTLFPDGAYRGALHELLSIPPCLCLPSASAHTPITVVRTEYVIMSFPSAPFSRNRLSLLSSMVACVYRSALLARHWI